MHLCKGADPIVLVRPQSQMDPDGFLKALGEFPADKTGAPVDALVKLWNGEMTRAIDMIAPKRPLPLGRAHSSAWYTPELRAMKRVGRRLERRWRKSQDESERTHLRAHYRAYAVVVRVAKKKFSASIASSQCCLVELFRVVQGLVHPGPKKDPVPPSTAYCDDFAKHFKEKIAQICHELDSTSNSEPSGEELMLPSGPNLLDEFQLLQPDDMDKVLGQVCPTTCLLDPCPSWLLNNTKYGIGTWILEVVNASLRDGRVPAPLKEAVVQPVLKKASLDPEMATNYRLAANIPFLGKVLEWVVVGQLQALLDETDYLDPFQSGFRPRYGTESALVALYDDLCREKDRGSASLLVLLDLSAAFDTIDHGILLDRLAGLGGGGTALQWFRSYLNGRFQKVVLGNYGSAPWQLCHGVPQGSILSPLLFNIYMKSLGEAIRRCRMRNHQYADDTQLNLSFSTNPGEAVAVLNRCLAEEMGWVRANKLRLNPDKTEVLLVGSSGFGEGDLDLVLSGVALPLKDKVRSLGVLLDPELSLEAQVTGGEEHFQLRLIHQLRPYLENDCLVTVTHTLVTSRLDFCNVLYMGLPLKMVRILQLVQNRAARLLTGTGHCAHITPVLRQLHWLPIEARAQFKLLVITYKALNGLGPGYLKERLRPYVPSRPLRSVAEALLREPSVKDIRRPKEVFRPGQTSHREAGLSDDLARNKGMRCPPPRLCSEVSHMRVVMYRTIMPETCFKQNGNGKRYLFCREQLKMPVLYPRMTCNIVPQRQNTSASAQSQRLAKMRLHQQLLQQTQLLQHTPLKLQEQSSPSPSGIVAVVSPLHCTPAQQGPSSSLLVAKSSNIQSPPMRSEVSCSSSSPNIHLHATKEMRQLLLQPAQPPALCTKTSLRTVSSNTIKQEEQLKTSFPDGLCGQRMTDSAHATVPASCSNNCGDKKKRDSKPHIPVAKVILCCLLVWSSVKCQYRKVGGPLDVRGPDELSPSTWIALALQVNAAPTDRIVTQLGMTCTWVLLTLLSSRPVLALSNGLDEANKLKLNPAKMEVLLVGRLLAQLENSHPVLDWIMPSLKSKRLSVIGQPKNIPNK
ncbi:RNA-directed DNA polymerase from mobile element jockey [Varanus komodoensis]|nr:RNA-directed DNA polymerase from mobile element jockey [Varanus komodoensis]